MKNKNCISSVALPMVLGIALAVCTVIRTMVPMAVLPKLDIPNMVLVSLIALLISHYAVKETSVSVISALILSVLSFGLLPLAAGVAAPLAALKIAAVGGVVYTVISWLFAEMTQWLSSGSGSKAAPALCALGLYLAAQCFSGMIL